VPTKRLRRRPLRIGLTAEALEAWRIGDELGVIRALGLQPSDFSPFHVDCETPPEWVVERSRGSDCIADVDNWRRAWDLRQALQELGGPPGRVGRHGQPWGKPDLSRIRKKSET
jgi:hypothetical protein